MSTVNLNIPETPEYALTVVEDDELIITLDGATGPTGPAGADGPAGVGIAAGGTAGQALTKIDATDYNTQWSDVQLVGGPLLVVVKNNGVAALAKGEVVYFTGANGDNILIGRAQANSEPLSSKTIGFTNSAFTLNGQGYVITEGFLTGLAIPHQSCSVGDPIWLSPTVAGGVIFGLANKPSSPNHLVYLGVVKKIAGPNVTEIYVKIQNGFELQELHNVTISASGNALTEGDILSCYDSTTDHGYWKNEHTSSTGTAGAVVRYTASGELTVPGVTISDPLENSSGKITFAGDSIVLDGDLSKITASGEIQGGSLSIKSASGGGGYYIQMNSSESLTTDRTISWDVGDASRTITLSGNPTLGDWFNQSVKTTASPTFVALTINGNISSTGYIAPSYVRLIGVSGSNEARIYRAADGILTFYNAAETGFSRLQFGGTSASFSALQTSGTTITAGLANGTAGGAFVCSGTLAVTGAVTLTTPLGVGSGGTGATTVTGAKANLGIVKYEVSASTSATSTTAVDITGLTGISFDADSVYKIEWQFDGSCSVTTGLVSVLNVPSITSTTSSPATYGLVNRLSGGTTNAYYLTSTTISLRGEDAGAAQTSKTTGGSLIFKTGATGGTGKVTVANVASGTGTATIARGILIITKL